jgi:hypothetical protein
MRQDVYLIDEEYVKQMSSVSDNLDSKMIKPCIYDAQIIHLQPIIGTKLFDTVCGMVDEDSISNDGNEKYEELLIDYIQPYLLQKVQELLVPTMFMKTRNAGNVQYYDNSQQNVQLKEQQWIMDRFANNATFLSERMSDFICANRSSFPEYCKRDSVADMPSGRDNKNICPIHLDEGGYKDTSIKFLRSTRYHDNY